MPLFFVYTYPSITCHPNSSCLAYVPPSFPLSVLKTPTHNRESLSTITVYPNQTGLHFATSYFLSRSRWFPTSTLRHRLCPPNAGCTLSSEIFVRFYSPVTQIHARRPYNSRSSRGTSLYNRHHLQQRCTQIPLFLFIWASVPCARPSYRN